MAFDANYARHPQVMQLNNGALLFNSQWEGYLKDLVQPMRPEVRQAFLDGITRHSSEFDQVERLIVFGPKISSPSPYRNRSHIGIAGVINNPTSSTAFLKLYYYGNDWIFADRVAIRVDDEVLRVGDVDFWPRQRRWKGMGNLLPQPEHSCPPIGCRQDR